MSSSALDPNQRTDFMDPSEVERLVEAVMESDTDPDPLTQEELRHFLQVALYTDRTILADFVDDELGLPNPLTSSEIAALVREPDELASLRKWLSRVKQPMEDVEMALELWRIRRESS